MCELTSYAMYPSYNQKTAYPSAAHRCHGLSQSHTHGCITHRGLSCCKCELDVMDVELLTPFFPNSSSVDIDLLRVKGKGPKCETP